MPTYKIRIEERALLDIQQAFDYYDEQQKGLGIRFNQSVFHSFDVLSRNPFYQIRTTLSGVCPSRNFHT
jgi:hypothetical protein